MSLNLLLLVLCPQLCTQKFVKHCAFTFKIPASSCYASEELCMTTTVYGLIVLLTRYSSSFKSMVTAHITCAHTAKQGPSVIAWH